MKSSFKLDHDTIRRIQIKPGSQFHFKKMDTSWVRYDELRETLEEKKEAKLLLRENTLKLSQSQELLYATGTRAVLIVLQGMDAAGKDGTIKHVMSGSNPQGCHVQSFKEPSQEELRHNFLWRFGPYLPPKGHIGIFNRSYYEEVLAVKVHPEWLDRQRIGKEKQTEKLWTGRYEDINAYEHHLTRNGIVVLKFFLHISKTEQKRRLLERLQDQSKLWKFSPSDLSERAYWDEYTSAYEEAISATSSKWAPWYIIPADHKWAARALIADVIVSSIMDLKLRNPEPTPEVRRHLNEFKRKLEKQ